MSTQPSTPTDAPALPEIVWSPEPAAALLAAVGGDVLACVQCGRCTAGCPVAPLSGGAPHRLVRWVALGAATELAASPHPSRCVGCATCSRRCPSGVDVATVVARLRTLSPFAPEDPVTRYHAIFLRSVARFGRVHELGVARRVRSVRELWHEARYGWRMLRAGKLRLRASRVRGRRDLRALIRRVLAGGEP
jgi:heterodisulfide reductase subunit C